MATYKVLQDIEAEDTLIGPLTLRQCIYAAIAVLAGYIAFMGVAKHVYFLVIFMLPFIAFGLFFAFPWSKQQSTEVWALAKVRFYFKPRKRIWNQSGVKELVTITVPKNVKKAFGSALTETEVESRLKALADTIDSRGWAVKNVDLGYFPQPGVLAPNNQSDRLVDASSMPRDVPNYDPSTETDMFDVQNNPIAQKFDVMMAEAAGEHRQQIMQQMATQQQPPAGPQTTQQPVSKFWHMRTISPLGDQASPQAQGSVAQQQSAPAVASQYPAYGSASTGYNMTLPAPIDPNPPVQMQQPMSQVAQPVNYSYVRVPSVQMPVQQSSSNPVQPPVTPPPNPAILELANNNDLNVATIAREAQSRNPGPPDEVVISLH